MIASPEAIERVFAEQLYQTVARTHYRAYEDEIQDVALGTLKAIRAHQLSAEEMWRYFFGSLRNRVINALARHPTVRITVDFRDWRRGPEALAIDSELTQMKMALAKQTIDGMPITWKRVLTTVSAGMKSRQACRTLRMTSGQYRNAKGKALARLRSATAGIG